MIDLVYCADGNSRLAQIAIDSGLLYGAQLPRTVYHSVWFADQNWKKPNREKYMAALRKHKPYMASVLDLERPDQVEEVLGWAEDVAAVVETVMIIPKYRGALRDVPLAIGGKPVRLGYSIPTGYGGSGVPLHEFCDWPVHLLGGGPTVQLELWPHLNIVSADGNMLQKGAMGGMVFDGRKWVRNSRYFGRFLECDMMYEAFGASCINWRKAWEGVKR